jgi:hypothetical protein
MQLKSWWHLSADIAMLGVEAQRVMTLRFLKLAAGGPKAASEAVRMVAEKVGSSAEAAATLASGGSPHKVVRRYRTVIRANEKRLTKRRR